MHLLGILVVVSYMYKISSGLDSTENQTSINVRGVHLQLPLKISIISDIKCSNAYNGWCPNNVPERYGTGARSIASILVIQKYVNENPELWPFRNMTISVTNTRGFYKEQVKSVLTAAKDPQTLAVFGLENTCDLEGKIADEKNKLIVSYFCAPNERHSTFVQFRGQYSEMAYAVAKFVETYGWDRVVVVYFYSVSYGTETAALFSRLNGLFLEKNIQQVKLYKIQIDRQDLIMWEKFVPRMKGTFVIGKLIRETYLTTRVYILLSAMLNGIEAHWFSVIMSRMGLLQTGEYAILSIFPRTAENYYNGSVRTSQGFFTYVTQSDFRAPLKDELYDNHRAMIMFTEATPEDNPVWQKFQANLLNTFATFANKAPPCPPLCNITSSFDTVVNPIPKMAATMFDSILSYILLATKLIKENTTDITDGYAMKQHYFNFRMSSASITGVPVVLDGSAQAIQNVTVSTAMMGPNGKPGIFPVGFYEIHPGGAHINYKPNYNASFSWPTGSPPPARPRCGFEGKDCPVSFRQKGWLIAVFSVVVGCFSIGAAVYYWRRKIYGKRLRESLWKVLLQDLVLHDLVLHDLSQEQNKPRSLGSSNASITSSSSTLRMHRSRTNLKEMDKDLGDFEENQHNENSPLVKSKPSETQPRFKSISNLRKIREPNGLFDWRTVGSFATAMHKDGTLVALKRVHKTVVKMTEEWIDEILEVRTLNHNNLNRFVGLVYEQSTIFLVSEFCQKGSLKEMVENEQIKLDRIFLASIVFDMIHGLEYLHSSKKFKCHGRMKSSNCVIDSKWTLRLSEFGMFHFLEGEDNPMAQDEICRKSLWTAPEVLRADSPPFTPQADIYAFGIILHEIYGRQGPFADPLINPVDIIQRIKFPKPNEPLCRPDMRAVTDAPNFIRNLMKDCWNENPDMRPSVSDLAEKCKPLKAGLSDNMVDNMVAMIQKYTNNLEELVNERREQLELEQDKADALLAAMLPKKVAETLKNGLQVEPEPFDCVTLYFSDIVGFATMIRNYTPYQIMGFLHKIYARFDQLINQYDVYKVETIGDSYMVVSGLPNRNGERHAGEIASMALKFLKEAKDRKLQHPANETVQLRIGIHTGPVVAGVVGLKMPRYCLFGDTVNTTSRMESTGQALKIHCSAECLHYLGILGGYETKERGYISMKGKGEKLTHWLISEIPSVREERIKKL